MTQSFDDRSRELRRQIMRPTLAGAVLAALAWLILGRGFWSVMLSLAAGAGFLLALLAGSILRRQTEAEASWKNKERQRAPSRGFVQAPSLREPPYGEFGDYQIDPHDEPWYGMFVKFSGRPVFLDVRPGQMLDERKAFARRIEANAAAIADRFVAFVNASEPLHDRLQEGVRILHIGMCAKSTAHFGEVSLLIGESDDGWTCLLTSDLQFRDLQYSS